MSGLSLRYDEQINKCCRGRSVEYRDMLQLNWTIWKSKIAVMKRKTFGFSLYWLWWFTEVMVRQACCWWGRIVQGRTPRWLNWPIDCKKCEQLDPRLNQKVIFQATGGKSWRKFGLGQVWIIANHISLFPVSPIIACLLNIYCPTTIYRSSCLLIFLHS